MPPYKHMGFGSAYFNFIPGVLWVGLGRTLWILGVFWRDGILKEMPCKRFIRVRPIILYSTRRFIRREKDFAWLLNGRLSLLPNSPLGRWSLAAEWLWCRGCCLKSLEDDDGDDVHSGDGDDVQKWRLSLVKTMEWQWCTGGSFFNWGSQHS